MNFKPGNRVRITIEAELIWMSSFGAEYIEIKGLGVTGISNGQQLSPLEIRKAGGSCDIEVLTSQFLLPTGLSAVVRDGGGFTWMRVNRPGTSHDSRDWVGDDGYHVSDEDLTANGVELEVIFAGLEAEVKDA